MKSQTRAIVASAIVIVLALSAVSGVTYSWFSDSETSEININSAKIDIEGHYTGIDVTTGDGTVSTDTTASMSSDKKDISISNLVNNRIIKASYVLSNSSTVDVLYRMYVIVEGVDDDVAASMISIKGGVNPVVPVESLTFENGVAYAVGGSSGVVMEKPSGELDAILFTLTINSGTDLSFGDFKIKIVNEAYQVDYKYSKVQMISKAGEASLPAGVVSDSVSFIGTTPSMSEAVNAADTEVVFPAGAINTATNNGSNNVVLKTKMLESGSGLAKISLNLEGAATTDFGTEKVTVSLSIPGQYTGLNVVYTGSAGEQPTDVKCVYDSVSGMTKITFSTTHFSEFEVVAGENSTADVYDMTTFRNAVDAGVGTINVIEDINLNGVTDVVDDRIVITSKTTLNLGAKIIFPDNAGNNNNNFAALFIDADTTINATGNGGIDTGKNGAYGINVRNGAVLTINEGTYYGGGTAVQVQKGVAYINGGSFDVEPYSGDYGYNFVLNCIDSAYKDGTAKIVVKGGVFSNFDPSDCKAEGEHTNFVADGYVSMKNDDKYVVSEAPIMVSQGDKVGYFADLDSALVYIEGSNGSDPITVTFHKSGTYLWNTDIKDSGNINFVTDIEGVVIDLSNAPSREGGHLIYADNCMLSFNNISLKFDSNAYAGFVRAKSINYNNCIINGMYTAQGITEVFKACTFIAPSKDSECVYSSNWGTKDMTFTGCTFYAGKYAINVYADLNGDERSLVVNGCKFYNLHQFDDSVGEYELVKSAVRMKACSAGVWNVTITDCENLGGFVKESKSGETIASADDGLWSFVIGGGYGVGSTAKVNGEVYSSNATSDKP